MRRSCKPTALCVNACETVLFVAVFSRIPVEERMDGILPPNGDGETIDRGGMERADCEGNEYAHYHNRGVQRDTSERGACSG